MAKKKKKKVYYVKSSPFSKARRYTSEEKARKSIGGNPFAMWKFDIE